MSTDGADEPADSAEVGVDGTGREVEPEVPQGGSGTRRRLLWLVAGVVLVAVAVVAGLVVFGEDESAAPTRGHASTLEPLALGDEPIWTADRLAGRTMTDSPAITVRDDAVLLRRHGQFSVLDMASGQVHWSISNVLENQTGGELPGLDGAAWGSWLDGPLLRSPGGEPAILTDYWYPPELGREKGVALLSAETGEVLWRKDIPDFAGLGAADDHTALVATTTGGGRDEVDDLGVLKTLALDMGTGETRWEQTGVWPDAVSGDIALGHRSLKRHALLPDETTVVALDLDTGVQKWDLSERRASSRLALAAGDVALVEGSISREPGIDGGILEVVAADSGVQLHGISGESCYTDERTQITCAAPSSKLGDLHNFDITKHTMTQSQVSFIDVTAVWRNRVFLEDFGGRGYSVDRTGATVDEKLPGVVIAISDRYAIFDIPEEERTEVYRLTG